ncbi:MAG: replication protein RepA, partial [Janthinobacterium lividum]
MDDEPSNQTTKEQVIEALSPIQRRIISASSDIRSKPPDKADFLHSVMCQAGLPRSRVEGRAFSRSAGGVSIEIEAGSLWDGKNWVEQPLPYGTKPRLMLVHLSSEAVIKKRRDVEIGSSIRSFLETLGISATGGRNGSYNSFKAQMMALAACRMRIGLLGKSGHARTVDTLMIEEVETWLHPTTLASTHATWRGTIVLSQKFYDTLIEHAVPLDRRA